MTSRKREELHFNKRLYRIARATVDLNDGEIAAAIPIARSTFSAWMAGAIPAPRHQKKLADILGVDMTELYCPVVERASK